MLYTLYRPILDQTFTAPPFLPRPEGVGAVPLISTDLASAELIKYAANAFLALKISYINEIGQLAEKVGADITQVARGIGLDARIGDAVSAGRHRLGRVVLRQGHRRADRHGRRIRPGYADRQGRPRGQPATARAGGGEAAGRAARS